MLSVWCPVNVVASLGPLFRSDGGFQITSIGTHRNYGTPPWASFQRCPLYRSEQPGSLWIPLYLKAIVFILLRIGDSNRGNRFGINFFNGYNPFAFTRSYIRNIYTIV